MSPLGQTSDLSQSARNALTAAARTVKKASEPNRLQADVSGEPPPQPHHLPVLRGENMRRSGTFAPVPERHDPHPDAPRLTSAFVAQLLGQLLPDPERRVSDARHAYDGSEDACARLLDAHL